MSAKSLTIRIPEHLRPGAREVLRGVCNGRTVKQIAETMGLSVKTVGTYHMLELYRATGLHGTAQLTKLGIRIGLTEIDV